MGQAKRRGTYAERVAQAQKAQAEMEPINIECQTCKALLNGFHPIEHTPDGTLWEVVCTCGAVTSAMVMAQHANPQRGMAQILPTVKERCGADRKMSVSMLEKSPKTVNTGMVVW